MPESAARQTINVRVWEFGRPREVSFNEHAACVDIVRPTGDVIQMVVNESGDVLIRAWKRAALHENGGTNETVLSVSGRPFDG